MYEGRYSQLIPRKRGCSIIVFLNITSYRLGYVASRSTYKLCMNGGVQGRSMKLIAKNNITNTRFIKEYLNTPTKPMPLDLCQFYALCHNVAGKHKNDMMENLYYVTMRISIFVLDCIHTWSSASLSSRLLSHEV